MGAYYLIGRMRITDPELYKQYSAGFGDIFKNYKGKLLCVDDAPDVLEGEWDGSRIAVLQFESKEEAQNFYQSKEYQDLIANTRWKSSETTLLLAASFNRKI